MTAAAIGFKDRAIKKKAKDAEPIEFVKSEQPTGTPAGTNADLLKRKKMILEAALATGSDNEDYSDSASDSSAYDSHDDDNDDVDASDSDSRSASNSRKAKFSAGSFNSMGLMPALLKAIQKKGFRQPTPIQRKCIGPLLEGHDVVGMARTGSGKTAAFVIPMIQKLKAHSVKVGVRGLVLAPTRELAMQTQMFIQAMAKFTDLRSVVLVGGDAFDSQFSQLASNPDIIVASPGRLLHLCVEAKFPLSTVEYVVFDEADRLFELGFAEQLNELLALMPSSRQTALFSATLPKNLVDFAAAGLSSPQLIRLDAESKLSEDLACHYLACPTANKDAALVYLLKNVINTSGKLTIIFAATKHHVEYLQELLKSFNFPVGYIYGSMDQEARELAISNFRSGRCSILIVTDVAARGIDIPLLDVVINYDFPGKAKLFIHRVGRAARAGRSGEAYSLVSPDELPYLIDLQLFLGLGLTIGSAKIEDSAGGNSGSLVVGTFLQEWLDAEQECIKGKIDTVPFLEDLKRVTLNAYKLYHKTRSPASPAAHNKAKELQVKLGQSAEGLHPMFAARVGQAVRDQVSMISAIRGYKPKQSHLAFELGKKGTPLAKIGIRTPAKKEVEVEGDNATATSTSTSTSGPKTEITALASSSAYKDDEFYLPYTATDAYSAAQERGYSIKESFMSAAKAAVFDLGVGQVDDARLARKNMDRSRKNQLANQKRIKTDSGNSLPETFKSGLYEKWQKKTHLSLPQVGDVELSGDRLAALAPKKRWVTKKKIKTGGSSGGNNRNNRK